MDREGAGIFHKSYTGKYNNTPESEDTVPKVKPIGSKSLAD